MLTGTISTGDKQDEPKLRGLALLTTVVADLLGYTGAGLAIGYLAWSKWGAPWWVLVISSVSGLGLAFYRLYLLAQKLQ